MEKEKFSTKNTFTHKCLVQKSSLKTHTFNPAYFGCSRTFGLTVFFEILHVNRISGQISLHWCKGVFTRTDTVTVKVYHCAYGNV